jgi:uncharacterized membrane protein YdjX (TVP38/TMEM64 family)
LKLKLLVIGILLIGLCLLLAWKQGWIVNIINLRDPILVWCRANPIALFAAIAILPSFAFPVSPLLILAGVVWGANLHSCGLALAAVLINITWSHLLAAGVGRTIIQKLLGKYWEAWSKKSTPADWRLTCILRITPGIPLCFQNYLLGLLGVRLRDSLLIAIPTTGLYVCGFVLTGGAIFEGQTGLLVLGISILIAASLTLKLILKKISNRQPLQP